MCYKEMGLVDVEEVYLEWSKSDHSCILCGVKTRNAALLEDAIEHKDMVQSIFAPVCDQCDGHKDTYERVVENVKRRLDK